MRICFVVADVRDQQPNYAGVYLALSAHRRGHDVRFVSVDDLSFLDDNNVLATTARVRAGDYTTTAQYAHALASDEAVVEEDTLGSFDVVCLRYNPIREGQTRPGAPLIDFGWRLRLAGTLVVNDPEGLRRAGSRMYLGDFPADIRTRTLVSRSKARLKAFLRELDGPAVIKPLAPRGNEQVFYLRRRQVSNLNQIISAVTKEGYALAQEYLPEAEQGEKRLLLLNAEPIRVEDRVAIYRRRAVTGPNGAKAGSAVRGAAASVENFREAADVQMHMAHHRSTRSARPLFTAAGSDHAVDVERIGGHRKLAIVVPPGIARAIRIDFNPQPVGIPEIERLAHQVIRHADFQIEGCEMRSEPSEGGPIR